jgi:hypothetical protein
LLPAAFLRASLSALVFPALFKSTPGANPVFFTEATEDHALLAGETDRRREGTFLDWLADALESALLERCLEPVAFSFAA